MKDMIIIGGGPAGLSAALYGTRANRDVLVVEKNIFSYGQISESDCIDNYLGIPHINGYELGQLFQNHVKELGGIFKEGSAVRIWREQNVWKVELSDGTVEETKTVIYCCGAAHRHLNIPGEDALTGKGVSYCATCDGSFYKGRKVAVIGGGNTALGEALYLSDVAQTVYLIHRREVVRGFSETARRLEEKKNVEFLYNCQPVAITGTECVTGLTLQSTETKGEETLEVDGVFIAVGMEPQTKILESVVDLDENGYIIASETGVTSGEGFFVAGDVRTKALRQVITAVSDGANAAVSAEKYISTKRND